MDKRLIWIVLGVALIAGCQKNIDDAKSQAQQKINETATDAQKKAEESVKKGISNLSEAAKKKLIEAAQNAYAEAMKVGAKTPEAALNASRDALGEARVALDKGLGMDSPERKWITNLDRQIARIDTASMVQSLEEQTDAAVKKAQKAGQVAAKNADDVRKELREKNPTFKELDDKRIAAQKQLSDMTEQLKSSVSYFAK